MPQETAADIQTQIASLRSEIERQRAVVKSSMLSPGAMAEAVKELREMTIRLGEPERNFRSTKPRN
jgi:hypothetical protein